MDGAMTLYDSAYRDGIGDTQTLECGCVVDACNAGAPRRRCPTHLDDLARELLAAGFLDLAERNPQDAMNMEWTGGPSS
jgi:hypothetical protein